MVQRPEQMRAWLLLEGSAPEPSAEPQVRDRVTGTQEAPARQDLTHYDLVECVVKNYGSTSGKRFVDFYKPLSDISASEFAAWRRSDHKHCGKHKRMLLDKVARELAAKI